MNNNNNSNQIVYTLIKDLATERAGTGKESSKREGRIVCEYGEANPSSIHDVVSKLDITTSTRMSYAHQGFLFHYLLDAARTRLYVCVGTEALGRVAPFSLLQEIQAAGPASNAALRVIVEKYNKGEGDKISRLKKDITEVHGVMLENVDRLIQRGEAIDSLVNKTEDLSAEAMAFHGSARTLRRRMCIRNAKMLGLIFVIVSLVIFLTVVVACGGFKFKDCK
eukprot:PhM_4_TR16357/c0_g1_i1/m.67129/K08515/VAMP7; vesicle-associated membrane protein 7